MTMTMTMTIEEETLSIWWATQKTLDSNTYCLFF